MKKNSEIILQGLFMGILFVIGGGLVIWRGSEMGIKLEERYNMYNLTPPMDEKIRPKILCLIGFVVILIGIIVAIAYIREWYGPTIEAEGKVVEVVKRYNNGTARVIIEFKSGVRSELIIGKKLILSLGDTGFIGAQGKHLVYFKMK